ncbi:MAG TPA: small, acid-soluble spore protein, alpha/beta type [Bacilli bacterium]|nr:small, acid-soluble spore protein, alpha/beta type [Bacilli bacterium]
MNPNQQRPAILQASRMQEQFRYEIARELGLTTPDTTPRGRTYNRAVISGPVAKRMVDLADTQMQRGSL